MNTIAALFVASCLLLPSLMYAAESNNPATEDYIWQERFNEQMELARTGNAEAQFNIGEMYEKGSGTSANMKNAFTWFELAAKQNHQKAQFKIAYMYYRGEGVEAHPGKAFQMMERLAKAGYTRAQYYLALMYEVGVVTPRDLDQARLWYSRAAASGYPAAQDALTDKKRFPAKPVLVESARAEPPREQQKNDLVGKTVTPPTVQPFAAAKNISITAALRNEASRGTQIALGLDPAHTNSPPLPLMAFAGSQPVIQMQSTPYSFLTSGSWVSQTNLPSEFLPSKLTSCEAGNESVMECKSKELVRMIGEAEIGYTTQATVYAVQPTGEFKIIYRNNIVKINRRGDSKITAGPEQEIKLGLQKTEHHLECKLENERTIQCVKNHLQKITLSNTSALLD